MRHPLTHATVSPASSAARSAVSIAASEEQINGKATVVHSCTPNTRYIAATGKITPNLTAP